MSTTKPPAKTFNQSPLDAFGTGATRLPLPWTTGREPALACELCDDATGIIIASDVATLCSECFTRLAKLPLDQIPATLHVLRLAKRRMVEARATSAARRRSIP